MQITQKLGNNLKVRKRKRFGNKIQLINNHLKALFNIEAEREIDKSLRFIVDHVNKN